MKYIAFYGAWGTSILCLLLVAIKIVNVTYYGIIGNPLDYTIIEGALYTLSIVVMLLISVVSAWIVCDMRKRMKDL
jgi:hypothetical protein